MKYLIVFNKNILGMVEQDEIKIGEVYKIRLGEDDFDTPLVVKDIVEPPKTIGIDVDETNVVDEQYNIYPYDRVAFLTYNVNAEHKYKKKTSQRLEKRMAKSLNGRTTPGSGAFNGNKGDVKSADWLGEHKFTDKKSYSLSLKIWAKINREAKDIKKTPILEIVLDNTGSHLRLMFMDLSDFHERTKITEEQFVEFFYLKEYKPRKNSTSVTLEVEDIQNHINDAIVSISGTQIPGIFVTFENGTTLFGILASDFEVIFSKENE